MLHRGFSKPVFGFVRTYTYYSRHNPNNGITRNLVRASESPFQSRTDPGNRLARQAYPALVEQCHFESTMKLPVNAAGNDETLV
jgi:hypothetical protein